MMRRKLSESTDNRRPSRNEKGEDQMNHDLPTDEAERLLIEAVLFLHYVQLKLRRDKRFWKKWPIDVKRLEEVITDIRVGLNLQHKAETK
jgi:hypothetical protein